VSAAITGAIYAAFNLGLIRLDSLLS